jgi:hypothetical protein
MAVKAQNTHGEWISLSSRQIGDVVYHNIPLGRGILAAFLIIIALIVCAAAAIALLGML